MKKLILIPLIFSFAVVLTQSNYAQNKEKDKTGKKVITENDKPNIEKLNTVCPVSREEVGEDVVVVKYKGKSYQVCCKKCAVKFNNDPEKYLKRMKKDKEKVKIKKGKAKEKK